MYCSFIALKILVPSLSPPLLTLTPCSSLHHEAHSTGTVVPNFHHVRWTAAAGAVLQHHLVAWTQRSRTRARRGCGGERRCEKKGGGGVRINWRAGQKTSTAIKKKS